MSESKSCESVSGPSELCNYINGQPIQCSQHLDNINPANNKLMCKIPRSNKSDLELAVTAAKKAYPSWSGLSYEARAKYLDKIADLIEQKLSEFAYLESLDTGKPLSLSSKVDIPRAVANFRFFAGAIRHDHTECHIMSDAINYTTRHSVGIAGLITPWNLPLYLLSWKIAPALAMGNVVIAKPSELTPLTANYLTNICTEAGLPEGVLNILHGYGPEIGQAIVEHPEINLISFTGGTVSGRKVAATASPMLKKLSLELGGKNATVVFSDCDWENTLNTVVRASFANSGQICLCGSRLLIQRSIYDKFLAEFIERVKKLKIGDPLTADFGPLTSLQHREKIEYYVELAKSEGGKIALGGKRPELSPPFSEGAFYEPTIITDLSPTSRCSTEEIFGPVLVVHPFDTESEALQIVNNTKYGLAGALFTNNLTLAHRFTKLWQTGMIWINQWLNRDLRVPFGGIRDSGIGTEGGRHSIEFYSNPKNICVATGV